MHGIRYTSQMHADEMHAGEMHDDEMHADEMHADEILAYEIYVWDTRPRERPVKGVRFTRIHIPEIHIL